MDIMTFLRAQLDRVAAAAVVLGGAIVILCGWLGASGAVYPAAQIPYIISGGIFGLFLVGVGAVLWLSADLRDEWRKLDRIEETMRQEASVRVVPESVMRRDDDGQLAAMPLREVRR
jgi:hypothetical protein